MYYNDPPPPWFTPALYAFTSRERESQCIAPRRPKGNKPERCRSWITSTELAGVNTLQKEICNSTDVLEIVQKMRQLVLARCCTFGTHREKLSTDAECYRQIAETYIDEFTDARLLKVSVPRDLLLFDTSVDGTLIVPYTTDSEETIDCVLRSDVVVGPKCPALGVVYAFSLPSYHGIVKIGHSGRSWQARMGELEECMPKAKLVLEKKFCYPERMERLIHLQLQAHRRKIVRCVACQCTHCEFFQLSTKEVEEVFNGWATVLEKEPLYVKGCLTEAWVERLDSMTGDVSASSLLKVLEEEERQAEEAAMKKTEETKKAVVVKEEVKEEKKEDKVVIKKESSIDEHQDRPSASLNAGSSSGSVVVKTESHPAKSTMSLRSGKIITPQPSVPPKQVVEAVLANAVRAVAQDDKRVANDISKVKTPLAAPIKKSAAPVACIA